MTKIILGTTSKHRKKAFERLGLDYTAEGSNVDEYTSGRPESPVELVRYLSKLKAEAVAQRHNEGVVIGFDSVGLFNGIILEKPRSREEAFKRLKDLSGGKHQFFTGMHLIDTSTKETLSRVVQTNIYLRGISDREINKYLDEGEDYKTLALGYHAFIKSSASFVRRIEGSANNLESGLPIEMIPEMLSELENKAFLMYRGK